MAPPDSVRLLVVRGRDHYLIDNMYTNMLAEVERELKSKTLRPADPVPIWDCRAHPFRTEREKEWGTCTGRRLVQSNDKPRPSKLGRGTLGSKMNAMVRATRPTKQ